MLFDLEMMYLVGRDMPVDLIGLPFIEGRTADLALAATRSSHQVPACAEPDDLLFPELTWLHVHPLAGDGLYPFWRRSRGSTHSAFSKTLKGDGITESGIQPEVCQTAVDFAQRAPSRG
jgi:hypothetical protein